MTKPVVDAFFVGRALAQALNEQIEQTITNALSELGKFDAEQRERLRQFTQEVMERANHETAATTNWSNPSRSNTGQPIPEPLDLQATIDELRAEIAQARVQLQQYRSRSV